MTGLVTLSFILLSAAGSTTPAKVAVVFESTEPINAIEAVIELPGAVAPAIADGPVLSYWIEKPAYDAPSRTVSFAGVVPGGSTGGTLLVLNVPAQGMLRFGEARAYLDSPDGTEVRVERKSLNLSPRSGGWAVYGVLLLLAALAVVFVLRHLRVKLV